MPTIAAALVDGGPSRGQAPNTAAATAESFGTVVRETDGARIVAGDAAVEVGPRPPVNGRQARPEAPWSVPQDQEMDAPPAQPATQVRSTDGPSGRRPLLLEVALGGLAVAGAAAAGFAIVKPGAR